MHKLLIYHRSLPSTYCHTKPAVTAASAIQPAVAYSAIVSSSPSVSASVSEDSQLSCRFGWLQSLFGSLGFNLISSTAPSTVPDTPLPLGGLLWEWCGMKLHNVDSRCESSGVGALDNPAVYVPFVHYYYTYVCSDRILTCRIKSIRSPAKVGLVVTDLITSPVVSWEVWETPPPPSTAALLSFFAQPPAW